MAITKSLTAAYDARFVLPTGRISYLMLPNQSVMVAELFYSEVHSGGDKRAPCIMYAERGVLEAQQIDTAKKLQAMGLGGVFPQRIVRLLASDVKEHIYLDGNKSPDPVAEQKLLEYLSDKDYRYFNEKDMEVAARGDIRTTERIAAPLVIGDDFDVRVREIESASASKPCNLIESPIHP